MRLFDECFTKYKKSNKGINSDYESELSESFHDYVFNVMWGDDMNTMIPDFRFSPILLLIIYTLYLII